MPYLTVEEVRDAYPDSGAPLGLRYYHSVDWWNDIVFNAFPAPIRLEFNDNIRNAMPNGVRNGKGIYMFFAEPSHAFNIDVKHILYIGRVLNKTTNYNFFRRFDEYVKAIGNRGAKRNRMRMANLWPNKTYVYFFVLDHLTDQQIIDLEKELVNNIVPPLNEQLEGRARLTRLVN